ncbi:MAG: murein L,D-transpeptidase catalytic domain family protein [Chitinophagaceae bacterium]|nr:murein L,D-transpeptidase catalytic domain family protein [Chitinophagaceae bacterium]
MKKNVATSLLLLLLFILPNKHESKQNSLISQASNLYNLANLYTILQLKNVGLNEAVFNYAIEGYLQLLQSGKLKNPDALSIIDFSMPSTSKRLFIVDVVNGKLLFNTYVAHGRNSVLQTANSFSNAAESFKSILVFYTTETNYIGKHGYSLRLEGLEAGFNNNAMSRGIVMHAANYVDERIAKAQGYIGRSLGCPAVPEKLHTAIIGSIANGTCLFMYANDKNYLKHSAYLRQS